jgi:WD40 repeat protein
VLVPILIGLNLFQVVRERAGSALLRPRRAQAHPLLPGIALNPTGKLSRVISGHLGWVRAVAVEPGNQWFATGAGDRVIKVWDLASGELKVSLTGHISTVRGLAVSPRHPYLFSAGEDKVSFLRLDLVEGEGGRAGRRQGGRVLTFRGLRVDRWSSAGISRRTRSFDTTMDICRVSTVWSECERLRSSTRPPFGSSCAVLIALRFFLRASLHPTLDVLVTAGRDATARVRLSFPSSLSRPDSLRRPPFLLASS